MKELLFVVHMDNRQAESAPERYLCHHATCSDKYLPLKLNKKEKHIVKERYLPLAYSNDIWSSIWLTLSSGNVKLLRFIRHILNQD